MSEMCGWLVGLPAPAPACMCGVEGSRPQPLTQASALKETESGEARAALTIYDIHIYTRRYLGIRGEDIIPSAVISRPRYPCDDIAMNHMTSFRISYNMISC